MTEAQNNTLINSTGVDGNTAATVSDIDSQIINDPAAVSEPVAEVVQEPVKDDAPQEEKKPEGEKEEVKKVPLAPEKYEFKVDEKASITPEVMTKFETIARDLDLPQEAAQKMLDLAPELSKMYNAQLIEQANVTVQKWAEDTKKDKELSNGGDKAVLEKNLAIAARARDAFASKELVAMLGKFDPVNNPYGTGLGNHPEVIRLFTRLGKAISEDNKMVSGSGSPSVEKTHAQKLYSN